MRKLVTIRRIDSLKQIKEADKIELVFIDGWQVVVKKGEFKVNDFCVYFEVDSLIPVGCKEFEFLRSSCYKKSENAYRIKTIRLKGEISQGIVFPLSILENWGKFRKKIGSMDYLQTKNKLFFICLYEDLTNLIGVRKYDPQAKIERQYKEKANRIKNPILRVIYKHIPFIGKWSKLKASQAGFPSFLHKTDEVRVQNIPFIFEQFKSVVCYVTEKLDGQSVTFAIYENKFYVCSRNFQILYDNGQSYWNVAKIYEIKKKLKKLKRNICIQGEIIGSKIQGNKYKRKENEFYIFNAFDIDKQKYYSFDELKILCVMIGIPTVPILRFGVELGKFKNVQNIVKYSDGNTRLCNGIKREGIVVRSLDNKPFATCGVGETFSFKVINPEFLLDNDE